MQRVKSATKKPPCVAYLDIKAAYDSVPRQLLWKKCSAKRLSPAVVACLEQLFDGNESFVTINGVNSRSFYHPAGVQQGAILSPLLYSIFIDDLPEALRGRDLEDDLLVNCVMYADDVAIVAKDPVALQKLLDRAQAHAVANYYRFATSKCVVIGSEKNLRDNRLYGKVLPKAKSFCYLGVEMNVNGIDPKAHVSNICKKAAAAIPFFRSVGMNGRGFSVKSKIGMYKSFIRSRIEYGLSILNLTKESLNELQKVQNQALCTMFSV